jgi:hypothetical protein
VWQVNIGNLQITHVLHASLAVPLVQDHLSAIVQVAKMVGI